MNYKYFTELCNKLYSMFPFVDVFMDDNYSLYEVKFNLRYFYKGSDCNYHVFVDKVIFDTCDANVVLAVYRDVYDQMIKHILNTMEAGADAK